MKARFMDIRAFALAAALCVHAVSAHAGDEEWTDISPPVPVTMFAAGAAPGVLYVASATDGVYLSEDGGETWISRNNGLTVTNITAIAAAFNDPNRVIVAEEGHQLVVSNDRGASWTGNGTGTVNYVTAIVFDPDDDDVIYALDDGLGTVLKSTDGGTTWTQHSAGLPPNPGRGTHTDLVIVPQAPERLYVATNEGVFRSDDHGETWTSAQGPELPSTEIVKLAEHPGEPDTVAGLFRAGEEIQFWRTNTAGESWYRPANDQTAKYRAQSVKVDVHDPTRLLVGGGNGVFGSVSTAHHWVDLNNGLGPDVAAADRTVPVVAFDPHVTRRYFVVTEGTVQVYEGLIATDLVVTGAATPDRVDGGETTTVAFTVTNITGEAANEIGFEFVAPEAFEIGNWSFEGADCGTGGQVLSCTIATLAPGEARSGEVTATAVGGDGLHDFVVSAFAVEREASPDDNELVLPVRIGEAPADDDDDGNGGTDAPPPPPPTTPPQDQPRPPSSGRSGGGNGGWLFLLAGAPLLIRRKM